VDGRDRSQITVTPIPKLDTIQASDGKTPPERIPRVDEVECVGCNLCWLVCPVDGCITMEQVSTGLPSETWAQRVAEGHRH
jgi:dihydropyrimidine dehydrogenase (NAD+) subunit PreA